MIYTRTHDLYIILSVLNALVYVGLRHLALELLPN